jgi:signal peptidase I
MIKKTNIYSLKKSRQILQSSNKWYRKKRGLLTAVQCQEFEFLLKQLDDSVLKESTEEASEAAQHLETFCQHHFKKTFWQYLSEFGLAVMIALAVAVIVRQTWFELYEIPTGSMRPTFKEKDHLTVTKTAFGINVPLATRHFYFDPSLVQRASAVIWSGEGIPHLDSESKFMGIFPYTKRYIKRCLGKPGDILYFYGGKIYGFDQQGHDLVELRESPWMAHLEHLPFTNFEGRRSYSDSRHYPLTRQIVFHHFNQPIGRLRFSGQKAYAEVFNGHTWIEDHPEAQRTSHQTVQTFSDWWGMRNFAMARLLTKEQLERMTPYQASEMEEGVLYLELRHTPSLSYPHPLLSESFQAILTGYSAVIPLQEKHLKTLMDHMYTCRFIVKNGRATSYRLGEEKISSTSPTFPQVPDGTYEFYYGKASRIRWGGMSFSLPSDHPLYSHKPRHIQKLFNVGIEMTTHVEPQTQNQPFFPNRYIYFRDGALYAMGGILMEKEDPILQSFHEREKQKEEVATRQAPYVAFKDYGPPLREDGKLDREWIKNFGFRVPDYHYLMLGDNHAMSQDSRYFGPIPEDNLQGAPSIIIWPPGERWGIPNQKPYPLFTTPRLIVWSLIGLIGCIWFLIRRRRLKQPVFKKLPLA